MATATKTTKAPLVRLGMSKGDTITLKVLGEVKTSANGKTFLRAAPGGIKVGDEWENSTPLTIFAGNKMEFPPLNVGDTFSFTASSGISYSESEYEGVKKCDGITNFNFADQISNIKTKAEKPKKIEPATSDI